MSYEHKRESGFNVYCDEQLSQQILKTLNYCYTRELQKNQLRLIGFQNLL